MHLREGRKLSSAKGRRKNAKDFHAPAQKRTKTFYSAVPQGQAWGDHDLFRKNQEQVILREIMTAANGQIEKSRGHTSSGTAGSVGRDLLQF